MTIVPDEGQTETPGQEVVLGVDTHKDVHIAAVLTLVGKLLAVGDFPTTFTGYREMFVWAGSFGALHRAGVEGTGSYGAALTRILRAEGIRVVEVNRLDRSAAPAQQERCGGC